MRHPAALTVHLPSPILLLLSSLLLLLLLLLVWVKVNMPVWHGHEHCGNDTCMVQEIVSDQQQQQQTASSSIRCLASCCQRHTTPAAELVLLLLLALTGWFSHILLARDWLLGLGGRLGSLGWFA